MKCILFIAFALLLSSVSAQKTVDKKQLGKDYSRFVSYPKIFIRKDSTYIQEKDNIHPHLFESLTLQERDSFTKLIHERKQKYEGDSITVFEDFFLWKPLMDRLNYEDPHYWVWPLVEFTDKKFKQNDIHVVPVNLLIINDTVIVDKTCDTVFHVGDRIMAINNVPIENFLTMNFLRYVPCAVLQQFNHFFFSPRYIVDVERNGKKLQLFTNGVGYDDALFKLSASQWKKELLHEHQIGYIELDAFYPNNSLLINQLAKFIKKVQKAGYKDVIIDVRKNTGGSGHNFDHLISLFTSSNSLYYTKRERVRVSKYTLDYGFPEDSIGILADLPANEAHPRIPLKPKKYLGEMNYYVLMSHNTQSIASSFVNILQTNGLAKLCGEALSHNALKYGEVMPFPWRSKSNVAILSTVEIEEYTKSQDGQIYPDIEIPYVASEYMQGGDPLLEKLLKYIQDQRR